MNGIPKVRAGVGNRPLVPSPSVVSVNVGEVGEITWRGRRIRTGIWKQPLGDGGVLVGRCGLEGDEQADRSAHGGPDKAVYAYAREDYAYWRVVEGIPTEPGLFGENLTLEGLDLRAALVGERWRVGGVLLEVTQPRLPCYKLGIRLDDAWFPKRFLAAARLGAYLRVLEPGRLSPGQDVRVVERPEHGVTLALVTASVRDLSLRSRVAAASQLPASWWGRRSGV